MSATDHNELVSKLKRSLSKRKKREIYISIAILRDFGDNNLTMFTFHTPGNTNKTTKLMGYVASFSEAVSVATSIAKHAQDKKWDNTRLYFNGIKHDFEDIQDSKDLGIPIKFDADDANEISERMMDEGVRKGMLRNIKFLKLKGTTPYTNALDFIQHKLCDVINNLPCKTDTSDYVKAISNFIYENKPDPSSIRGRSIISLATSIAQSYYESDTAVEWLLGNFGEQVIFGSTIESEMLPLIDVLEHEIKGLKVTPLVRYAAKWFMYRKGNSILFREGNNDELPCLTKRYVDYYMNNISTTLEFCDIESNKFIEAIKDMTTYPLKNLDLTDAPFTAQNYVNCPLITYLLTNYTCIDNGISNIHERLIRLARAHTRMMKSDSVSDNVIDNVRTAITSISMPPYSPVLHFDPLRMALLQVSSSNDIEHCMAIQMLSGIPKEDVAKKLMYKTDIKPFLEHYDTSPLDLMEMLDDEELKSHVFELISS
jgi:hypothetical protein